MELYIDTSKNEKIGLSLKNNKKIIENIVIEAKYSQAELLLPAIEKLLKKAKIKLSDLHKIFVADEGEGFTALRIGVVTANTLGYALGIPVNKARNTKKQPFSIVKPKYNSEPNITYAKK